MNDEMRQMDQQALERIKSIMADYESDINNASQAGSKDRTSFFRSGICAVATLYPFLILERPQHSERTCQVSWTLAVAIS